MRHRRSVIAVVALAAASALAAGCGDDEGDSAKRADDTATTAATTTETATAPGTTSTATDAAREVTVEVDGGAVSGGPQAIKVAVGEPVRLTVKSDVADEVHVHGVDVSRDVEAGGSVTVDVTPDTAGSYEIELERSGILLAMLEVRE